MFHFLHQLTPLHRAARRGRKDVVEYLFQEGAKIDERDGSKVQWMFLRYATWALELVCMNTMTKESNCSIFQRYLKGLDRPG